MSGPSHIRSNLAFKKKKKNSTAFIKN